jgi:hypothetical protein
MEYGTFTCVPLYPIYNWGKIQLLYNIQNGSTPSYLLDLIPSTIQSTVREWNNLNLSVRNLDTLSKLKKEIRSSISMPIPRHYSYCPRKLNTILTQLRCNASFLNYDLCKVKFYQMLPVTVAHHLKILTISFLIVINIQIIGK